MYNLTSNTLQIPIMLEIHFDVGAQKHSFDVISFCAAMFSNRYGEKRELVLPVAHGAERMRGRESRCG